MAMPLLLVLLAGPSALAQAAGPAEAPVSVDDGPSAQLTAPVKAEGPQTTVTVGLIRTLLFSAMFSHPWAEVSVERRIDAALSLGVLGGLNAWNDPEDDGFMLFDILGVEDLGGERQYIGAFGRLNLIGSFTRNIHLSA